MTHIDEILPNFRSISLLEMDSVKLMNRVDTKFVMTESNLEDFLRLCLPDYRALTIDGLKSIGYKSLYFDTPDRQMYLRHLFGRKTRQKVRTRTYLSSGLSFLEVKRKDNHGRTRKKRIEIPRSDFSDFSRNDAATDFLCRKSWYSVSQLVPTLNVAFSRITLVNDSMTERMTIDRDLSFDRVKLNGIVIVEIKQDGLLHSAARQRLHSLHIPDFRISKYCIGTAISHPELPHNRINPKIRYIRKLQNTL